jgi:hypothetical protein
MNEQLQEALDAIADEYKFIPDRHKAHTLPDDFIFTPEKMDALQKASDYVHLDISTEGLIVEASRVVRSFPRFSKMLI